MERIAATIAKRMRTSVLELFRNIAMVYAGDTFHEARRFKYGGAGPNDAGHVARMDNVGGHLRKLQLAAADGLATACHAWAPI